MFVQLMDAGVDGAELDDLLAYLGDETAIRGAASRGKLGRHSGLIQYRLLKRFTQLAFWRQEGFATQGPLQIIVQLVPLQHCVDARLQGLRSAGCGKTEI